MDRFSGGGGRARSCVAAGVVHGTNQLCDAEVALIKSVSIPGLLIDAMNQMWDVKTFI